MVISISGPQSSGKTTLLTKLKELYPRCNYIEERYRQYVNNKRIDLSDPEFAFLFEYEFCMSDESLICDVNQCYITDRCSFDTIVYLSLFFLQLTDELKKKYLLQYTEAVLYCRSLLIDINYIFLTTAVNNNIEDDGVRPTIYNDLRDQEIHLFNTLIKIIHKPYVILPDNIDERIKIIIERLKK